MKARDIKLADIFESNRFKDIIFRKGYRPAVNLVSEDKNILTFSYKCSSSSRDTLTYLLRSLGLSLPVLIEGNMYYFNFKIIFFRKTVDCVNAVVMEAACLDCSTLPENHNHQLYSNLLTRNVRRILGNKGIKGVMIPDLSLSHTTMIQFDEKYGDLIGKLNLVKPTVFKDVNQSFGFMFIAS